MLTLPLMHKHIYLLPTILLIALTTTLSLNGCFFRKAKQNLIKGTYSASSTTTRSFVSTGAGAELSLPLLLSLVFAIFLFVLGDPGEDAGEPFFCGVDAVEVEVLVFFC